MASYRPFFARALAVHYPGRSAELLAAVEAHYARIAEDTRFAAASPNPIDRRLDFSAYFLALILTLDERGEPYQAIRTLCLQIVGEYVRPKNRVQALLKRLPARLIGTWPGTVLLKAFAAKVSRRAHPDGFVARVFTDKAETLGLGYGFDILECGICKLFHKHRYARYAAILCEVDEVTSGLAGLQLVRTSTIALGAAKCDFRFKKATAAG
ncbi:MAG TPA: L-2-amino-thiazoline-4-carboxylic acid hydrolase [Cytophagales bacterium]|jgi:hypothetical protein